MGNSFAVSGTLRKASSGKSYVIELVNQFGKHYLSIVDVEEVRRGHKKTATIWIPKNNPRLEYRKRRKVAV